ARELRAIGGRGADLALVAEDDVLANAGVDRVGVLAADDDVVARAGRDRVAAAQLRIDRPDAVDVGGGVVVTGEQPAAFARRPVDEAVVAEDDVVAVGGVDGVRGDAADDDVAAVAGDDRVGAA